MAQRRVRVQRVVSADGRAIAEAVSKVTVTDNAATTIHQWVEVKVSAQESRSCSSSSVSSSHSSCQSS